jgi:hypothetical protein
MGKRLLSLLLSGTSVILFDNADGSLNSKKLAAFATSATWTDRELGKSSMRMDLPIRTLLLANGRNITTGDGFSRRVIPIEILPAGREMMTRTFDFSPDHLASEMRDEIIGAALTLIAAVPSDFSPGGAVPSFRQWDRFVRRTVAWLCRLDRVLVDPLSLFTSEIANDAEFDGRVGLLDFIAILQESGLPAEFLASDVLSIARESNLLEDLREHLKAVSASSPTMSTRSIGTILALMKDQPLFGRRLSGASRKGRLVWKVEEDLH